MNSEFPRPDDPVRARCGQPIWGLILYLVSLGVGAAAPTDPGRLFFTPAQRAQLEAVRARNPIPSVPGSSPDNVPAPLRYDGLVIRSDGTATRWIDGKARHGGAAVLGLKPGQIRANGQIFEPYQVMRPQPSEPDHPDTKDPTP